jgi:hypothetical protein
MQLFICAYFTTFALRPQIAIMIMKVAVGLQSVLELKFTPYRARSSVG